MKLYMYLFFIFLFSLLACITIGNYAGGALYFYLSDLSFSGLTWWSLFDGLHLPYKHPEFASAVWGAVLAAWIVFLPVLIIAIYFWMKYMSKYKSLYGNARFANDRELKPFHYTGEYN